MFSLNVCAVLALAACSTPSTVLIPDSSSSDATSAQGPQVTITQPADHTIVAGSRSMIVAGVLSTTRSIQSVAATINDVPAGDVTFTSTSFSVTVTLGDNTQTIAITAVDDTGQSTRAVTHIDFQFFGQPSFANAVLELGRDFAGVTPIRLTQPYGRPWWDGATLWIGDYGDGRLVGHQGFPSRDEEPADLAVGAPDLHTSEFMGTPSARVLGGAQTAQVANGKLYVIDDHFARLLAWNTVPTISGVPADLVIGQLNFTTSTSSCTASTIANSEDFIIAGGKLILADTANHRVLIWNTIPTQDGTAADVVVGQGDFTHCTANDDAQTGSQGTPTARTLWVPSSVWSDGFNLIVADRGNNRVLIWSQLPTTSFAPADHVLGQPNMTGGGTGCSAVAMYAPYSVDSNGTQLALADNYNNRVLIWNTIPTTDEVPPDTVLGQADFTHCVPNDDNQDGVQDLETRRTLAQPAGVRFVRDTLIVADENNNRVLLFGALPCPFGSYETPPDSWQCAHDPCYGQCVGQYCDNSTGVAVCY